MNHFRILHELTRPRISKRQIRLSHIHEVRKTSDNTVITPVYIWINYFWTVSFWELIIRIQRCLHGVSVRSQFHIPKVFNTHSAYPARTIFVVFTSRSLSISHPKYSVTSPSSVPTKWESLVSKQSWRSQTYSLRGKHLHVLTYRYCPRIVMLGHFHFLCERATNLLLQDVLKFLWLNDALCLVVTINS